MYFETHITIKKIPKYCKKNLRICKKKLHCFSLFQVLYNCVKFRRLKIGDPVYNLLYLEIIRSLKKHLISESTRGVTFNENYSPNERVN